MQGELVHMPIYNKLVRDKIPQIIEDNGDHCHTKILNNDEYLTELNAKLHEEMKEYLESGEIEELADLEEVLRAIVEAKGYRHSDFENIRLQKVEKRGAFKEKIFLISTN